MTPDQIAAALKAALPDAVIDVRSEDNTHFEALVVDAGFEGLRPLARHQRVYQVLGDAVGREIHALALKTLTPEEHAARDA
ncbi:MAG: BolA/IbaG family iron-sulfur metabolism protein [Pseudomonadota bacterium]